MMGVCLPRVGVSDGGVSPQFNTFLTESMVQSYRPCDKVIGQPCLISCPVSITFHKHLQQTDGVFLRLLQGRKTSRVFACVSVWLSHELKSKLSATVATEKFLLQQETS